MPETRKYNRIILLICLCTSFLVMMICTKASFLYPLQDWIDDNIIFTVGRGVLDGKVIYRDLYDQKGPLAFFLYAICGIVSRTSFIGLYFLESLLFGIFLYYSWKTISLFHNKRTIMCVPILAALVASSNGFNYGGSVEELSLPFLAYGLYVLLKFLLSKEKTEISQSEILINGIFAGCILWIKFSMLGFFLGWIISIFVSFLVYKKVGNAFQTVGIFLLGMLMTFVPIFVYFGVNGAVPNLIDGYFIKNIFGYTVDTQFSILTILRYIRTGTLHYLKVNAQFSLLILLGLIDLLFLEKEEKRLSVVSKILIIVVILLTCAGAFFSEYAFKYYGNVLMPFACLGFVPILKLVLKDKETTRIGESISYIGITIFSLVLCYCLSLSSYMIGWSKEQLPQYLFAKKMDECKTEENITLLSYDMLDSGFYLVSESEPTIRYFTSLNFASPELIEGQNEALNQGTCEFIVTMNEELSHPLYRQIDSAIYYYEQDMQTYYLYQRI